MPSSRISVSPLALLLLVTTIVGGVLFAISMLHQPPTTKEILAQQKIAIIGDSLTEQSGNGAMNLETIFEKAGYQAKNIYLYGVDGKRIVEPDRYKTTTLENIDQARAKIHKVTTWLIALGTNDQKEEDARVKSEIEQVLHKVGSDKVLWVNTSSRDQNNEDLKRINAVMKETLVKHSNATYLDWDNYVHMAGTDSEWKATPLTKNDPIHMTDAGYTLRNGFYLYRTAATADKNLVK